MSPYLFRAFCGLKRILDYAEYGGAPLLGVDGVVIIGHGRSNSVAVKNAIRVAIHEVKHDLTVKIKKRIDDIYQMEDFKKLLAL